MEISKIIEEYLYSEIIINQGKIHKSQNLIESGLVDSISIVKIILYLENAFSVVFSEEDMMPENFESIDKMEEVVCRKKR